MLLRGVPDSCRTIGMTATLHNEVQEKRACRVRHKTARAKDSSRSRLHSPSRAARGILRDMVLSLLETGCKKQEIVAALDSLADEAKGDAWQKVLNGRERATRMQSASPARATARRRGELNI
jgi:hypothetical protein